MSDLISRQAAIDALDEIRHVLDKKEKELTILPSAESDIIRCENCKHGEGAAIADGRRWCDLHGAYMEYCSDAERIDDRR